MVDCSEKSAVILGELEEHFAFVGGSAAACAKYLMLGDQPKGAWAFEPPRGRAGVLRVQRRAEDGRHEAARDPRGVRRQLRLV